MKSNRRLIVLLILCLTILGVSRIVATQNSTDNTSNQLVYVKIYDDQSQEFVQRSDTSKTSFRVETNQCSAISPSGGLIALSSPEKSELRIIRLSDQKVILQQSWSAVWQPCSFTWRNDEDLLLPTLDKHLQRLSLITGEVSAENTVGSIVLPTLPYAAPNAPKVWSSDRRFVVYNQCLDGKFDSKGEYCEGQSTVVVYDTQTQNNVTVLSDTNFTILGAPESQVEMGVPDPPSIFWSPSDRYLLYMPTEMKHGLKLYDLQRKISVDIQLPSSVSFTGLFSDVKWSLDERRLGLWVFEGSDTDINIPQRFIIWNSNDGSEQISANSYAMKQWVWSPSLESIALITNKSELLEVNLLTGKDEVVDTNVYTIILWTP